MSDIISNPIFLFITSLCILINLNLVNSKNLTIADTLVEEHNEEGEYEFAQLHHFHWNNQSLILPNVTTRNGVVRGVIIKTSGGNEVFGFLGIPFAKIPINHLRFRRPVPVDSWDETFYDAIKLPNSCSQARSDIFSPEFRGESVWNANTFISEDCLYLNIWVPARIFNESKMSTVLNTSVLFWIHGSGNSNGFDSGSSTLELYDGSELADRNDVIVVSSQYRLGPFGFLYFGNNYAPGNVGLLDQNLALQWVYNNIEVFGGGKSLITLIGQGSGAASISYHLLSPLSRVYFKRAILMSGVAFAPWAFQTPENAMRNSFELAELIGCGRPGEEKKLEDVMDCLYEIDPLKLIDAQKLQKTDFQQFPFVPTVDGYFISDTPVNLLKTIVETKDIIIGNTLDEGSIFTEIEFAHELSSTPSFTHNQFLENMGKVSQSSNTCHKRSVLNHYTNWIYPEDGKQNRIHLVEATGDNLITCPSKSFADEWSSIGNDVFYYHFTQRTSSSPWENWLGVVHGDDVEFVFELPLKGVDHTESEIELSKSMTKLFTSFAKTGLPSPNWKTYTQLTPVYLNLNATKISDKTTGNVYGPRAEACSFWNFQL